MVHAGNRTGVQEYQTRAAALQQIVRHAAPGRVPHENPPEVVKGGVILDPEVGLRRVADVEACIVAAVTRVVLELAVRGTEGCYAIARIVRCHVVVRAGPIGTGEDDSNSGKILYREARHPHIVHYSKHITVWVNICDTDAIEAVVLIINGLEEQLKADWYFLGGRLEDRYPRSRALEGDAILFDEQVFVVGARFDTNRRAGRHTINSGLNGLRGRHVNGACRVWGRSSDPGEDETCENCGTKGRHSRCRSENVKH